MLTSIVVQGTDGADGVTTLTIQPGVELLFDQGTYLYIGGSGPGQPGALSATGTALQPIVFTSNQVTHTPGFWGGTYSQM